MSCRAQSVSCAVNCCSFHNSTKLCKSDKFFNLKDKPAELHDKFNKAKRPTSSPREPQILSVKAWEALRKRGLKRRWVMK